jgi:hypothetical protein
VALDKGIARDFVPAETILCVKNGEARAIKPAISNAG